MDISQTPASGGGRVAGKVEHTTAVDCTVETTHIANAGIGGGGKLIKEEAFPIPRRWTVMSEPGVMMVLPTSGGGAS
ncbi:hypothetical protein [Endozoicomonas sp. GU-1]|uniref:hypothetical protein n=1 Tax=Endozoicomonas sp. GU-1 TaxID=3009078 RepID=UPI0022B38DE0|nr:hypothetical protein [Endozoicomonas sp. GU-1]WBA83396.1 hypothetical protein O2T12_09860 [Endozoicomonas sp. GU-1]